jgi:hypothetical protein
MIEQLSFVEDHSLPRMVHICIPPQLKEDALALAKENPPIHPAWKKLSQRGRHFVIATNCLDDISELADYARTNIEEPEEPLTKPKRQAYQILLDRAYRHAHLEPMGTCHAIATKWRDKPLPCQKNLSIAVNALRSPKAAL